MIKLIIAFSLYLIILLNIKCDGRKVSISLKIKDDWKEKREFIYLKNVKLEERFVLEKIKKHINQYDTSYIYNIEGFLRRFDVNHQGNIFIVEINHRSEYAEELKRRILIKIVNNKIFYDIHPGFEKQVFLLDYLSINSENYKNNKLCY
ncbi:unnamed protein product [Meloidogyne enterolobii]|uniref:Uncharacterized protein n=1 Tax=Meloidogyne enterolobii TaxID=390850 RepID=A0ACB0Y5C0_MELEN